MVDFMFACLIIKKSLEHEFLMHSTNLFSYEMYLDINDKPTPLYIIIQEGYKFGLVDIPFLDAPN